MARIDWALLCDHAFVDRHEQLSLIGIVRTVSVPCLPCARPQLVLVARLEDIQPVDEIQVVVGMVTPGGDHIRSGQGQVPIEVCREYVLVTLHDVPFLEEGLHRFQIALRGQRVVSIEIPVVRVNAFSYAGVQ